MLCCITPHIGFNICININPTFGALIITRHKLRKSKKLEASAQRFSQAFVGNGPVGAVYDVLTGIVDGFSGITESVGGFTAAMTALSPVITKFFPQLGIAYVQYAPLREIPVAA